MHAQGMPSDTSVPAMVLPPGAPPPFPNCNTRCIKGWAPEHEYTCPEHAR